MRDKKQQKDRNKGFTLIEVIIVVAIFAVLLGILIPSLNPILGFRVQRASEAIGGALDRTKTEAMNRLVAEVKLSYVAGDGYYITYYLDRGKSGSSDENIKADQPDKIAPAKTQISYTDDSGTVHHLWENGESVLILTYDRATGGFRQIQTKTIGQEDILRQLESGQDIAFHDSGHYCTKITISGGQKQRLLILDKVTGGYKMVSEEPGK